MQPCGSYRKRGKGTAGRTDGPGQGHQGTRAGGVTPANIPKKQSLSTNKSHAHGGSIKYKVDKRGKMDRIGERRGKRWCEGASECREKAEVCCVVDMGRYGEQRISTESTWKSNGQICAGSARKGEDA